MPATPTAATGGGTATSSGGGNLGRTLLIGVALLLLGVALLPTRVVAHIGLEPARAASARVALAVAGLSVCLGYLIVTILNGTP